MRPKAAATTGRKSTKQALRLSRRQFIAASGATTVAAAASGLLPAGEAYAQTTGGTYQLKTPYFDIEGQGGAFSSMAFDPTGKGAYGPNLLAGSGLLFQFQGDGVPIDVTSPSATATAGSGSLRLDIPVTTSFVVAQEQQNNGWDLAYGGPASQSFDWPGGVLSEIGVGLFSANGVSRPTGPATVTLLAGGPSGTQVASVTLDPGDLAQLGGSDGKLTYVALPQPNLPAGTYTITVESKDPLWALLYQSPISPSPGTLVLGHSSYSDRAMQFGLVGAGSPLYYVDQAEQNNGYDIHFGNGVVQTFVAPGSPVSAIGLGLFSAFGNTPTAPLEVSVLAGGPGGQSVFSTTLSPDDLAQIGGGPDMSWVATGVLSLTPGATYAISLQSSDGAWAALYQQASTGQPSPYPQGVLYLGGKPKASSALMFSLVSTEVKTLYQATWVLQANGPRLDSQLTLSAPEAHQVSAAGFSLTTPWEQAGYDVTNPATTPFSRFYDSEGEYLTIAQFKRRPAMFGEFSFDIGSGSTYAAAGARQWIHASGQNGYDLRFAWDDICCHFEMASDTFTFLFFQTGYKPASELVTSLPAGGSLSYPFNLVLSPATGEVPDYYPRFSSSDPLVNSYQTNFYWERGFAWLRGAYGADWPDWMGLALDWQGGPQRDGQRILLESITLSPDGYVYTWNPPGSESWPFPGPPYDSRHFTSNAQYVLGIAHYVAWTGDEQFFAKMLPRARAAIGYYLERLGGSKGLVTIDRGLIAGTDQLTHTGEDGSPGTNYWDLISYGWLDAYVNAYYYGALLAAADLEEVAGGHPEAARLRRIAGQVRRQYNQKFYKTFELPNGKLGGRYVGNIDDLGNVHDQGATYLNLEAMRFGLPDAKQGREILAWLDHGPVELTTNLVLLNPGGGSLSVPPGASAAESFSVSEPLGAVAAFVTTGGDLSTTMTLSLFAGSEPVGAPIATRRCQTVYNGWWANVELAEPAPAGTYCLQISEVTGTLQWTGASGQSGVTPSLDGKPISSPPALALVAVSAHQPSQDTVYTKYGWAPITASRKNNFHYLWLWRGVTVPFGDQLEDGGADLYEVAFDVIARARYSGADDAFLRTTALLERFSKPDHLCGGAPLYEGEQPENEVSAGAVGVDVPFPESALAPASFLYAYFGVEARPQGLRLRPALPSGVDWIAVENLNYRGAILGIRVDRHHVTLSVDGRVERHPYRLGSDIEVVP